MTREEAVALLERYSNYEGMGIPNLAGCKEAMKVAVGALKEAFPELAESEDERIRKALIEVFKKKLERGFEWVEYGIPNRSVLAWLEKQKEPQNKSMAHEDSSWSGILTSPLCKDKNLDDIAQEYVEGVKEYNPTPDWNLVHTAVCYGYHLAEQKEPKPLPPFDVLTPEEKMNHPLYLEGFDTGREVQRVFDEPSWKPSEEQMNALYDILYPADTVNRPALESLYEQLKKLIKI